MNFLQNDPRPCATLKQVFLDRFELVVAHFGPPKIPKCAENGLFWDQKWVKNGSKTHFVCSVGQGQGSDGHSFIHACRAHSAVCRKVPQAGY